MQGGAVVTGINQSTHFSMLHTVKGLGFDPPYLHHVIHECCILYLSLIGGLRVVKLCCGDMNLHMLLEISMYSETLI